MDIASVIIYHLISNVCQPQAQPALKQKDQCNTATNPVRDWTMLCSKNNTRRGTFPGTIQSSILPNGSGTEHSILAYIRIAKCIATNVARILFQSKSLLIIKQLQISKYESVDFEISKSLIISEISFLQTWR
mgnify:FL=1